MPFSAAVYQGSTAPVIDGHFVYIPDLERSTRGVLVIVRRNVLHGGDSWHVMETEWTILDPTLGFHQDLIAEIFDHQISDSEWHKMLEQGLLKPVAEVPIEHLPGLMEITRLALADIVVQNLGDLAKLSETELRHVLYKGNNQIEVLKAGLSIYGLSLREE